MKKTSIFLINLIMIIIILIGGFHLLNLRLFYLDFGEARKEISFSKLITKYSNFLDRDISPSATEKMFFSQENYRPIENITSEKKPIALFGCSYVQGCGLEEDQTFSYKLGVATGRPIYNRARGSWGVQHTLYQFSNPKLYEIIEEPEYIIYLFFDGLYSRMFASICYTCDQSYLAYYEEKDNQLLLKKRTYISDKVLPLQALKNIIFLNKQNSAKEVDKIEKLMLRHFEEIKKYQNQKWPNSNFIIYFFSEPNGEDSIKKLEDMGYIALKNEDLNIDPNLPEYKIWDGHPSEKFWDDVVPIIVKKYNL